MTFEVRIASWPENSPAIKELRKKIFVNEQGVSETEEMDGLDDYASTIHFLGLLDNTPIATGRVLKCGKIGRVCVLSEYRRKKYGETLLNEIIFQSVEQNEQLALYLHAQTSALAFYQKCGFIEEGDIFVEAGIPHQLMRFSFSSRESLESLYHDRVLRLKHGHDFSRHLRQCTAVSNRSIDILTLDLSISLFDTRLVSAISLFARSSKHAKVRALIQNTQALAGTSHPLVALSHRLPSSISLRALTDSPQRAQEGFTVFDKRHLVFFNNESVLEGFVNYRAPAEAQHQLEEFETLWRYHSKTDPNLGQLTI